ncbi:MAG: YciI family protein [Gaiellaceae bacterium]
MRFMLLQNYGRTENVQEPLSSWPPEDARAHIDFQVRLNKDLTERGELVEATALTAPDAAKFVVHDGAGAPVVTDGPFPESKELLAGYRIVDVESPERALEIAAEVSAAPGPHGVPIKQRVEVREIMGTPGEV